MALRRRYRKRKRYVRRRPNKNRGMQRIKTYRYRARNIGGDNAFVKLRYAIGTTLTVPTTDSFVQMPLRQFNSGNDLFNLLGNSPGVSLMAAQFTNYRISGLKLRITAWPSQSTLPMVVYTNAADLVGNMLPTPNSSNLPEARWSKYKVCNPTPAGATPTVLNVYYSVNKVIGPDLSTKTDLDFTGSILPNAPYWLLPPNDGPQLAIGLYMMSGVNPPAPTSCILKIEATVYAKFYGRRTLVQ